MEAVDKSFRQSGRRARLLSRATRLAWLYPIINARIRDLHLLAAVELAAATLLKGHAPDSVLNETTDVREFRWAQAEGRLWVALASDIPIGFAHAEVLGGHEAHLKEIDVHPDHGRRGLGTRMVETACDWAANRGYPEITLTTFRDVPWNMPFYARLGFEVVSTEVLSAELASIIEDEAHRGLDPARRVVMRRRLPS